MSLRFLSDQCVPAEITNTLRQHGHHVTLLREVLPIRSLDPVVIAKAQELGAILPNSTLKHEHSGETNHAQRIPL